jgi:hypothetical protein
MVIEYHRLVNLLDLEEGALDISRPVCKSLKIQMDVSMRREGLAWISF